jgi:hypothetical protein
MGDDIIMSPLFGTPRNKGYGSQTFDVDSDS